MKAELSKVLRDAGYANAAEFFTELFAVREEKRKYEEACKVWREECVRAEIEATKDGQYYGNVSSLEEEEHVRFLGGLLSLVILFIFYSKITVIVRVKNRGNKVDNML